MSSRQNDSDEIRETISNNDLKLNIYSNFHLKISFLLRLSLALTSLLFPHIDFNRISTLYAFAAATQEVIYTISGKAIWYSWIPERKPSKNIFCTHSVRCGGGKVRRWEKGKSRNENNLKLYIFSFCSFVSEELRGHFLCFVCIISSPRSVIILLPLLHQRREMWKLH